jgi:N-acetylmuramoyl-L-alanine amidase
VRARLRLRSGLALLSLGVLPLLAAEEEPSGPAILERSTATVEMGDRRWAVPYSVTSLGPLFSLRPMVERLGGTLEVGPLGDSHSLDLGGTTFLFGPGSAVVTIDEEIVSLSQPPASTLEGLQAPLDLLRRIYADVAGYELLWETGSRRLVIGERRLQQIPVSVDVVHLSGVTTVVLRFPTEPVYRLDRAGRLLRVQLIGDQALLEGRPAQPSPLLERLEFAPEEIVLRLAPGVAVDDYTLASPFRLVFELYPGGDTALGPSPLPQRPTEGGQEVIVLDPGHGGGDTGAVGPAGTQEKDVTLRLARLLADGLRRRLPVRVELTRDEDAELPLATRSALANQLKADLFLSLHLNSAHGASAHGTETYFLSLEASDERAAQAAVDANRAAGGRADPFTDLQLILWDMAQSRHLNASQYLANLIQEELNQALELRDRGVKQAPFSVLMGTAMPAVLVELGFLSNPEEEQRLLDPEYQHQLTEALVRAITRFRTQREGSATAAAGSLQ